MTNIIYSHSYTRTTREHVEIPFGCADYARDAEERDIRTNYPEHYQ